MKTKLKIYAWLTVLAVLTFTACNKPKGPEPNPETPSGIESLTIPASFNYATSQKITLKIHDEAGAKYDIYSLKSEKPEEIEYSANDTVVVMDDLNQKLASGLTSSDGFTATFSVPTYHKYLFVVRSKEGHFTRTNLQIAGNQMDYTYQAPVGKSAPVRQSLATHADATTDILYAVNGSDKKVYSIDLGTGDVSNAGSIPYTSIADAVDKADNRIYIANNKSPFQLGYFDLGTGTFTVVGNMASNFPRMDYNPADGLLYISNHSKIYTVNPANAQYLQTFHIHGLANDTWGDMAFADDGTLYLVSKSGVYKCTFHGNDVNATLISDNTLPGPLTSMAIGTNGKLYMSKSSSNKKIIEFDPATGSWQYVNISSSIRINDFGVLRYGTTLHDSDGDGVPDNQDDYPNDPERAFNNYYPGQNLWATLAFEDLWPSKGDYDFNDLVVGYNVNQVTNAQNKVVDIKATFDIRHNGAGLHNGFAFQIPVNESNIGSVTTTSHEQGTISRRGNGTEAGQDLANFIVFENTDNVLGQQIDMDIHFSQPQPVTQVGTPPYNPYLIKNGDVNVEVHLPGMKPTQLANISLLGTGDDDSNPATGRYYKTDKNLPWGINIVYRFKWMKEKQEIIKGYLHFADWAESGGTQYADWYKDLPGYRDNTFLDADK
jgi:LruC domain-containing protein